LHSINFKSSLNNGNKQNAEASKNLSLDEFLAKNTSEDNVSFEMLIEEAEKKKKARQHQCWLYEKEQLHKLNSSEVLMLENNAGSSSSMHMLTDKSDEISKSLDTWTYTTKNTLMYVPEGVPLTLEEELLKSKSVRKINHENTRFSSKDLQSLNRVESRSGASSSAGGGVAGMVNQSGVNVIQKVGVDGREANKETPKIRGYSLVDMSPSPAPGRLAGDESPMMVWGEIENTPFRLDAALTPRLTGVPEFKMPCIPEREKIALNLEEKASGERRKKKDEALRHFQKCLASPSRSPSMASPSSLGERLNNMSPAARLLFTSKLKTSGASPGHSKFNSSDSPRLGRLSSPLVKSNNTTPKATSAGSSSTTSSSGSIENLRSNLKRPATSDNNSLTDNLLKLPKTSS
jgi:protein DGCR14